MFGDYYNFRMAFSTHPNAATFFVSGTHKEAWYYLLFGIDTQEPFLVLTGECGMGKTLLCLRLTKLLNKKGIRRVEFIPSTNEGYGGILRRMASVLEISPIPDDGEILQNMINNSFKADTENIPFYLIIDDAHELGTTILTKLKHLSTFNHNGFFPMIMIFVGHPSFLQDLKTPALSSLNQRIKRRYHLSRFDIGETKEYIYFRLLKSGATGIPNFPDESIQQIFEYSGGVPRLINNICDTCLLLGASKKLSSIMPAVVDDAKKLVEGSLTEEEAETTSDSGTNDDAGILIAFSEKLPADKLQVQEELNSSPDAEIIEELEELFNEGEGSSTNKDPIIVSASDSGGDRPPAFINHQVSPRGNYFKKVLIAAVISILLLFVALLYQYLINDYNIFTFFFPATKTQPFKISVQQENTAVEIPTLREEMTDKSSESAIETKKFEAKDEMVGKPKDIAPLEGGQTRVNAPVTVPVTDEKKPEKRITKRKSDISNKK